MSNPFDTTLKTLVDEHVGEWVAFLAPRGGLPVGPARLLDTDLSATLQADRLIRVDGPAPFALHLEFLSSSELGVPARMLRYSVAAAWTNELPVASVLVLLRPSAAASDQTGVWAVAVGAAPPHLTFRYAVLRVWQEPMDTFLSAGPGLAPLAVLTNEAAGNLDAAFERFDERLRRPDVSPTLAKALSGAGFVLSGLRYDEALIEALYERLNMTLEDSTTYQLIMRRGEAKGKSEGKAEGEVLEARRLLVRLGTRQFGPPPAPAVAALDAVTDRERLEQIAERIFDAAGWDDLLATP